MLVRPKRALRTDYAKSRTTPQTRNVREMKQLYVLLTKRTSHMSELPIAQQTRDDPKTTTPIHVASLSAQQLWGSYHSV
eukprot:1290453-Heterocapsa_arctica.AAC.1